MANHIISWMNPQEFKNAIKDLTQRGEVDLLPDIINKFVDYVGKCDKAREDLSKDIKNLLEQSDFSEQE